MSAPQRIQLSRKKGWRKPDNTVVVARPSKWGNPWKVRNDFDAARCVERYKAFVLGNICSFPNIIRTELRGKNLACWCKIGTPCHADVLLAIANIEPTKPTQLEQARRALADAERELELIEGRNCEDYSSYERAVQRCAEIVAEEEKRILEITKQQP